MLHPTVRRCIFWSHLVTGIAAGLVILVLAVTGLLMSFETQIINAVERSMVREKSQSKGPVLSPSEMVAAFQKSGIKGRPTSVNYMSDPEAPVAFLIGRGNQQLFHPTTGESMGKGAVGTRRFFQTVLSLHRWLTLPSERPAGEGPRGAQAQAGTPAGERPQGGMADEKKTTWRDVGGQIVAAGTLVFLFLLVSGLVIWIPKKRVWKAFKTGLTIQPRLKGRARDWNWHNVAGIWASPFILFICITGLIMAYPWANKLLFKAFGEEPPKRQEQAGGGRGNREGRGSSELEASQLNDLASFAKSRMPDWKSMSLEIPANDEQPLVVTVTDAGRGRPDRREKFTIDPLLFDVLKHETFSDLKTGAKARQIVRWLHTGELGGWIGQLLTALTCSAVIVLIWTGFALSFRRFFLSRKKSAA